MANLCYFPLVFPTILIGLSQLRSFDWPLWGGVVIAFGYFMLLMNHTNKLLKSAEMYGEQKRHFEMGDRQIMGSGR